MYRFDLQRFAEEAPAEESTAPAAEETAESAPENPAAAESTEQQPDFRELIRDKRYKADYDASVERIVKKRLAAQERKMRAEMEPMMRSLGRKYKMDMSAGVDMKAVQDAVLADDTLLEEAASEAGMTVDGYRTVQQAQQIVAQSEQERAEAESRQRWQQLVTESEAMAEKYPGFRLDSAMQDDTFRMTVAALQANGLANPMEAVYRALHYDELVQDAERRAVEQARVQISNEIQSGQNRPAENGTSRASAAHKLDPRTLTKEQRAEIRKRIERGEKVTFS